MPRGRKPGRPKGSKNIIKRGRPPVAASRIKAATDEAEGFSESGRIVAFLLSLPKRERRAIIQAVELVG